VCWLCWRSRTDRFRPHRHPAPVAAAHFPSSQAAARPAGRALPRGHLAFFRLAEHGGGAEVARALLERLNPADQTISATASGWLRCAPRAARRRPISAPCRTMGPYPQAARHRRRGRAGDPRGACDKPFRSLLDLGTGTGRMLELFARKSSAASASICRSTCCSWRVTGWSAPA